ncbi:MAG: ExeM/NucH family extracellular endonuclease, partial [Acidimicrobiia bacterium]
TSPAVNINGDDAIELFMSGSVVDVFGEITFATFPVWAHTDGWVYRVNQTGQDGSVFVPENWTSSGVNALDGETSNATAAFPFPLGQYSEDTPPPPPPRPPPPSPFIINEVDSDTPGTDAAEFVELYDGGAGSTSLDGLVLVFYNGSDALTYGSVDLDGLSTDSDGYAVICGDAADIAAECDLDSSVVIQNGADAVALYQGDGSDFPGNMALTVDGLVDAVVYGTSDADVPGLLTLLNPGQPQVDEDGGGDGPGQSSQRCPDGSGGARNTDTFAQFAPTIGIENQCAVTPPTPVAQKIHDIQGSGDASPLVGSVATVEAVVVGDFQGAASLRGFNLQEEDADVDTDALTSEGIFVFDGSFGVDVSVGDLVEVTGTVAEFNDLTEITSVTSVVVVSAENTVTRATIVLPVAAVDDLEAFEGMAVQIPQPLFISEFFNFDRFGEIVLSSERQLQPTALYEPGSPEAEQLAVDNRLGRITLDDGRTTQNPDPAIHPNGEVFDLDDLFRAGDRVSNVTGVLDFAFGLYRVQPTAGADFSVQNPRPKKSPKVGGTLEVATFNVLNYFSTIDTGAFICGPLANQECRGADNDEEFTRQRDKIISAIAKMDADVVGLMEIENHATDAALADLVSGLNDKMGTGTYAYVGQGSIGPDAIRVGILYKPKKVVPVGDDAVLDNDDFLDPHHLGRAQNRPAQAQTFVQKKTGASFTVVVNHLKSKGSACGAGDDDPVQGNCNVTRTLAAQVLVDWLATDPTQSGDPDFLIIGDLNSYDKESPIDVLTAGGFTDLAALFEGEEAYSFLFDGQLGYLDYALANEPMLGQVTMAQVWHINADEPDIIDYDTSFKLDAQDALYAPDPFRSSDHDAVVVGLSLDRTPAAGRGRP